MKINIPQIVIGIVVISLQSSSALSSAQAGEKRWAGFRGEAFSHTNIENTPTTWSPDRGISWTVSFSGEGQSSPVVWGDRVFVTSIEGPNKETLWTHCVALSSGELLWSKSFDSSFTEENSQYISKAAPTPVVDAERVYFFFESGDLLAMSHDGDVAWRRKFAEEYGPLLGNHGIGGSPAQSDDSLIVLVDHKGPSYLLKLSKEDGSTTWKIARENSTAWSSPSIVTTASGDQEIALSSAGTVDGYAIGDGALLWRFDQVEGNNVPSISISGDIAVIGSRARDNNQAIRIQRGANGDASAERLWVAERVTSGFGSPLIANGRAYFVTSAGILSCFDLETGEELFEERLAQGVWASPLATKDYLYFFGEKGTTTVIPASAEFSVFAENSIDLEGDDRVYGYAVTDGAFVVRSTSGLVKIEGASDPDATE